MDLSSAKSGDKVTIEFEILGRSEYDNSIMKMIPLTMINNFNKNYTTSIYTDVIVESIEQKPIEVKIGTQFKTSNGASKSTVIHIEGNNAVYTYLYSGDKLGSSVRKIENIQYLVRAYPL